MLKNPGHIEDFLLYRMHNLTRLAVRGVGLMFQREVGISRRDWRILAFVGKAPQVSLTELAAMAGLDMVVTSRCVATLVEAGLIAKVRLASNKRITALTLTEAGRDAYERARLGGQRYNREFTACLSDEEAELFNRLLLKLEQQAKVLTQREIDKCDGTPGADRV
ncbi:MAG: MarR family transcriptional regulator [Pandoraea sp.]|nr:MAG: MarR family transcriptional regulator [Pandoraea sp.]TAM14994.1 MAG: MarR family transcriptional regulator [Pandoraea sp.]